MKAMDGTFRQRGACTTSSDGGSFAVTVHLFSTIHDGEHVCRGASVCVCMNTCHCAHGCVRAVLSVATAIYYHMGM